MIANPPLASLVLQLWPEQPEHPVSSFIQRAIVLCYARTPLNLHAEPAIVPMDSNLTHFLPKPLKRHRLT